MQEHNFLIRKTSTPKYIQMRDQLRRYIKQTKFKSGDLFFSEPQITKMFQVTSNTSRQAVQELINEQLIYSLQGKGSFICHPYIPRNKTKSILVFSCQDIKFAYSSVLAEKIGGMQIIAEKYGYRFQFCTFNPKTPIPKAIINKEIDGVIYYRV